MRKKKVLELGLTLSLLLFTFLLLPLSSNAPIKLRGQTTYTNIFGQIILTCDCTTSEDADCSCNIRQ